MCAVAETFLPTQAIKLYKPQPEAFKERKGLRTGSQCANQVVATLLETVFVTVSTNKYQLLTWRLITKEPRTYC